MKKLSKRNAALLGGGAAVAYSFIKGIGIFNHPRFYKEHKALKNYLKTYHPDSNTGDIVKTKTGWSCIINSRNKQILLNIEKTNDGNYVFSETDM